jgi:hypothetical protein
MSQPVVPPTVMPDEQARGGGRQFLRAHQQWEATVVQSVESVSPSPFDADAAYLEKTLRHEPMELALDDSVSLRTLGLLWLRAYVCSGIVFLVLGFFGAIEAAHGGGEALLIVAFLASIVVFWLVLLVSKVTEPIGEWRALLADRAGQAESYYRTITAVIGRRELPIAPRLRSIELAAPNRPVKHTIVLSENEYQTYVTVFPYGTSLYVGWQMWRQRSGGQVIKRAMVDRVSGANLVTSMLRTDRARAVREAVHLACREAIYATVDEDLQAYAQQLRLPEVERVLLSAQPASPVLPPPSAGGLAPSYAPAPSVPPQSAAPTELPYE